MNTEQTNESLSTNTPETTTDSTSLSVEQTFSALDDIVRQMESEDASIEDSFRLYQDGMKLLKQVSEKLDGYEKKMQILTQDGVLEDFT